MLVEREYELDLLHELFDESASGRGRVTLISGGVATGKTALLHAFCEQVSERGAQVLVAAGGRAERLLRMGVVWQLFHSAAPQPSVVDQVARLIGAEPSIAHGGSVDPASSSPLTDAQAVHGVCGLLLSLANEVPMVIAVDDAQYIDDPSLQVLRYLRRRMGSARVLLALTEWEHPDEPPSLLRADVTRQPHRRIVVRRLSEAGIAELLRQRLDRQVADKLTSDCFRLAGGNPFLTHALIEDHLRPTVPPGADPENLAVGPAFRDAILDCLHRWDPSFATLARSMALLGDYASPELVGELMGRQPAAVSLMVETLTTAGLVEDGRLRCAEIATTVGAILALASEDCSRLHAQVAELLYRYGADTAEVARHVIAAGEIPGPWAVQVLRHSANRLLAEDAGLAVTHLEHALQACQDQREEVALQAALARVAWRVNPAVAVRYQTPLQGALRAGELTWRDAAPVVRHLLWQGDLGTAASHLQAQATTGEADPQTAAELQLTAEWIYGRLRERIPTELCGWLSPTDRPSSLSNLWQRTAMMNTLWTSGADKRLASSAEHILQSCLGEVTPEVGAAALLALEYADRQKRATFWYEALLEEAVRQRLVTWQALLACVQAEVALRLGDLARAQAQAETALGLLPNHVWGVLIGYPWSLMIQIRTATGADGAAAELLEQAVPEGMLDTMFGLRYLHASGHYHLARGRPLAALETFERCGASMREWGLDIPAMIPWRGDLAQAYLALGKRREARELLTEQLDRPRPGLGLRTRASSLRALAGCSAPAERVRVLREARQLAERCGDRLELSRILRDLSHGYRELGEHGNARMALRRARQLAKSCRVQVTAARDEEPRRPKEAAEPVGPASLTEAERRVAELAANGYSNRGISRNLHITVSTVEQHLTRVYRKLNVTKRADLVKAFARPRRWV